MKRILWWLIAGTKGGRTRARIINLLKDRPGNANQIAEALSLDYKTVRHHLKVLEENQVVVSQGSGKSGYGAMYFLSNQMEGNYHEFETIWEQIGQRDN